MSIYYNITYPLTPTSIDWEVIDRNAMAQPAVLCRLDSETKFRYAKHAELDRSEGCND